MKVETSVTYKTASLRDMERGIDLHNRGLYGCVKIPILMKEHQDKRNHTCRPTRQ